MGLIGSQFYNVMGDKSIVILFLVALLLAWPTVGLSLIAYVAFAVFKSHLSAKARMHYANEKSAERAVSSGKKRLPSWGGDKAELQIFIETIQHGAMRYGVPREFLWAVLADTDTLQMLMHYAGAMEYEGASFLEQQVAVSDKLVTIWKEAPGTIRTTARNNSAPIYYDEEIPF